jgi:hypothetical protein
MQSEINDLLLEGRYGVGPNTRGMGRGLRRVKTGMKLKSRIRRIDALNPAEKGEPMVSSFKSKYIKGSKAPWNGKRDNYGDLFKEEYQAIRNRKQSEGRLTRIDKIKTNLAKYKLR